MPEMGQWLHVHNNKQYVTKICCKLCAKYQIDRHPNSKLLQFLCESLRRWPMLESWLSVRYWFYTSDFSIQFLPPAEISRAQRNKKQPSPEGLTQYGIFVR